MKKTKIDWCDSTVNCVYGCPNNCEYCYGNVMNKRFHFCDDWRVPEWKPEHLKDFYTKKPKSIFIDSMSDIGTWKQKWFDAVMQAMQANPQHNYIALTKRLVGLSARIARCAVGYLPNLYIGTSVTTQEQAIAAPHQILSCWETSRLPLTPDFYSIEPILEPITIPPERMPYLLIIGAETGNRKDKVVPQKEWIDSLVRQADEQSSVVFMKDSLREIMGKDFRQDRLPWSKE